MKRTSQLHRLQPFDDSPHTKIYSWRRGYCKGAFQDEVKEEVQQSDKRATWITEAEANKKITNITDDIVNP